MRKQFARVGSYHGNNFMAIFTTLSVVIWFSTGTLEIFATLVYVFIMRVRKCAILSMAIIPTLSTSILFCNLCYVNFTTQCSGNCRTDIASFATLVLQPPLPPPLLPPEVGLGVNVCKVAFLPRK